MQQMTFGQEGVLITEGEKEKLEYKEEKKRIKENTPLAFREEIKGEIELKNGIILRYHYKPFYISDSGHIEFRTDKPTFISETGYRSWFPMVDLNEFESVKGLVEWFIEEKMKNRDI